MIMNNKYNYGKIYKLYCKDENVKEVYIGSTINLQKRIINHKTNCMYIVIIRKNYMILKDKKQENLIIY